MSEDSRIILNAIIKIQRCYRDYRVYVEYLVCGPVRHSPIPPLSSSIKPPNIDKLNKEESKQIYWQHISIGQGSEEEKRKLWRNIIDIRRANQTVTTDLCLHALFAEYGNVSKASNLVSAESFRSEYEIKILSESQREFFMPSLKYDNIPQNNKKNGSNSKTVNSLHDSINLAQTRTSSIRKLLLKSYFVKRARTRNVLPGYLRGQQSSPSSAGRSMRSPTNNKLSVNELRSAVKLAPISSPMPSTERINTVEGDEYTPSITQEDTSVLSVAEDSSSMLPMSHQNSLIEAASLTSSAVEEEFGEPADIIEVDHLLPPRSKNIFKFMDDITHDEKRLSMKLSFHDFMIQEEQQQQHHQLGNIYADATDVGHDSVSNKQEDEEEGEVEEVEEVEVYENL